MLSLGLTEFIVDICKVTIYALEINFQSNYLSSTIFIINSFSRG